MHAAWTEIEWFHRCNWSEKEILMSEMQHFLFSLAIKKDYFCAFRNVVVWNAFNIWLLHQKAGDISESYERLSLSFGLKLSCILGFSHPLSTTVVAVRNCLNFHVSRQEFFLIWPGLESSMRALRSAWQLPGFVQWVQQFNLGLSEPNKTSNLLVWKGAKQVIFLDRKIWCCNKMFHLIIIPDWPDPSGLAFIRKPGNKDIR